MERYSVISRNELRGKMVDREENFTLIDVSSKPDYERAHLPQSINIPQDDITLMVPRLVSNLYEDLVVYCSEPDSELTKKAAELLVSLGYKDVKQYVGGTKDWSDAGLPVESPRAKVA